MYANTYTLASKKLYTMLLARDSDVCTMDGIKNDDFDAVKEGIVEEKIDKYLKPRG